MFHKCFYLAKFCNQWSSRFCFSDRFIFLASFKTKSRNSDLKIYLILHIYVTRCSLCCFRLLYLCYVKAEQLKVTVLFFRASYYDLNENTSLMQSNKYIFHLSSVSICFGQYIAHHQEINKMYKISIWCQTVKL